MQEARAIKPFRCENTVKKIAKNFAFVRHFLIEGGREMFS